MADNKQENYQNNQIFSIDIDKVYDEFIKEIDDIRSYVNTNNINVTTNLYKSIDPKENSSTPNNIKPEKELQESRCHAFYRLIGFPVVSADYEIYNPGHDITKNNTIDLSAKISIAKNPLPGFNKISNERETYVSQILSIFSTPKSIEAGTLALSSGSSGKKSINKRQFNSPFAKNSDPFDFNSNNQSYKIDMFSLVGKNELELSNYQNPDGTRPEKWIYQQKKHIIVPFIVDAKIDFSVSPSTRRVCVPFVPDKSFTKVSATEYAKRPLIEKVIRDRFSLSNQQKDTGTASQTLINYIKDIADIKDQNIINKINSGDIFKLSINSQFTSFIYIIQEMMTKLIDSLRLIQAAQGLYYWVPEPSKIGPEGGSEVRDVFIPTLIDRELITEKDFNILDKIIKSSFNQLNSQVAGVDGTPDVGGFAFTSFFDNFNVETKSSLGDNSQASLEKLTNNRKKILSKANQSLRTVEIIMGEFSGFGLCDIIAIMGALYIMPKEKLIGFLDNDAYQRLISINEFKDIAQVTYTDAMESFSLTVKDFYNLMDKIYKDLGQNNGLSS
jgi:hypothetical protein